MPRKIIIDTDPGQDDAVAILAALASPDELDVLGITAVAGNVPLSLTQRNAMVVCELAGKPDVLVHTGCDVPMQRKLVTAEHVHGKTGLDGIELPDPKMTLQDQHGVDFIIETLRREPASTVTLCPLGPLTNIATAFVKAPDIVGRVQEIVLMGGGHILRLETSRPPQSLTSMLIQKLLILCLNPAFHWSYVRLTSPIKR